MITTLPNGKGRAHYSDEWYTPPHIPAALGLFKMDPCAGPVSHLALVNLRRPVDGLAEEWRGRVWLNPPYSNIFPWLAKLAVHGNGIALVNARPDTRWFQEAAGAADGILFLKGRVKFYQTGREATQQSVGSVLLAYGAMNALALRTCGLPGLYVERRAAA